MFQNTRTINVSGLQNVEAVVSKIIKEEPYSSIKKVNLDGCNLKLEFEDDYRMKVPSYVKQISKKKYASINHFIEKHYGEYASLVCVVNLPKMWLIFFNK